MANRNLTLGGLAIAALGALPACGGAGGEPNPPPPPPAAPVVTTVAVTAPAGSLFVTDTLQLSAAVKDQFGAVMTGKALTWSSSNPGFATVDNTGRVIGVDVGSVTVSAAVDGKSGSVALGVTGPLTTGGASGTALLGPAGGSVQATLPGGGTVVLTLPAAALSDTARITLDPLVPTGASQAAFRITPAGLGLKHPATLVIVVSHGAKVVSSSALVFSENGIPIPVPSIPNPGQRSLTVTLSVLGVPDVAALRGAAVRLPAGEPHPAAQSPGTGNVVNLALDQRFADANAALQQLQQLGSFPAADAMLLAFQALLLPDPSPAKADSRFVPLVSGWRTAVCGFQTFAVHALESFTFNSDYAGLARVSADVFRWSNAAKDMSQELSTVPQPGCPGGLLNADSVITARLTALRPAIVADLNGFALVPSPRDSLFLVDRLQPILNLAALFQQVDFQPAAQLLIDLLPPQVDRMRVAGYVECGTHNPQGIQSRLLRLLAHDLSAVASFDVSTIETDVELCGMRIAWRLLDSTATPVADGTLGGGNAINQVLALGAGSLTGPGTLEIGGDLNALRCPSPLSANNEQLEILAGASPQSLIRIGVLTPGNDNTYLSVNPLQISSSAIRTAAALSPTAEGNARVMVHRIGGTCSPMFVNLVHDPLGALDLHLVPTPSSCTGDLRMPKSPAVSCPPPTQPPPLPPPSGNCPDIVVGGGSHALPASSDSLRKLTCIDNLLVTAGPVVFEKLTKVEEALAVEFSNAEASFPLLSFAGSTLIESPVQTSLDLHTLTQVWGLDIRSNSSLTSLTLGSMAVNGDLQISDNPALTTLSAGCGTHVIGDLTITNNPNLPTAVAQAFANCTSVTGKKQVSGNKP